jgi:glycosyltransferase involved in cell wall biosynthesis
MVAWGEYRKMLRYERRCVRNADHVFTVSENDRDVFTTFIDRKCISVIPTGVDTEYFQPAAGTGQNDGLVFTGAMDWMPNEDAILYFAREILPLIRKEIPQVTLTVAGRLPSRRLLALAIADNRIRVTGRVDDIRLYMREGSVFVVPIRVGSGTRLKIFEAMAMGKAVVSTSIGAEGLPVTDGENIVIADTPECFACSVVSLLRQPEQRRSLGLSARSYVEQKHSWKAVTDVFEGSLFKVVRDYGDKISIPAAEPVAQVGIS